MFVSSYGDIDPQGIAPFEGSHPAIIAAWLETHANPGFEFTADYELTRRERKHRMLGALEKRFGWDFSKRHFKIIREYQ